MHGFKYRIIIRQIFVMASSVLCHLNYLLFFHFKSFHLAFNLNNNFDVLNFNLYIMMCFFSGILIPTCAVLNLLYKYTYGSFMIFIIIHCVINLLVIYIINVVLIYNNVYVTCILYCGQK